MLETLKPELEATLQANQVPFASFGVTDANATRMQAEIGTAGAAPLDENHIFRIASKVFVDGVCPSYLWSSPGKSN